MRKTLLTILIAIFGVFLLAGCSDDLSALRDITDSGEITVVGDTTYDWGDINIAGGNVTYDFVLQNSGSEYLVLKGAETSCMCTIAEMQFSDGDVSPEFGMHNNRTDWAYAVQPGEEFTVHVGFDPMAHGPGGTGPIKRSITLDTSAPSATTLTVAGNVLSEEDFMALEDPESEDDHHEEEEYADMPEYEIRGKHVLEKVNASGDFVLIDVRESAELEETGIIEGAVHVPLGSISMDTLTSAGVDKNDEIIVYCRSGNRSRQAYELMNTLGYTNVKSMRGGVVHWLEDDRPLVSFDAAEMFKMPEVVETNSGAKISFDRTEEEFGVIGPEEIKTTIFLVKNNGTDTLEIGNITTSCACTDAEIASKAIEPGDEVELVVTFDPTVHEEPEDRFKRTVFLETNDPDMPEAEVEIWVDIDESLIE
ncbi:DUF1573 domain-containing protein [Candidatus Peregrinibacteria bacterium]|nr:DUF1573 domain-containing protein [Candidatus Peregrinibacteria bacterium]